MSTTIPITRSTRQVTLEASAAQVLFTFNAGPVWDTADLVVQRKIAPATRFTTITTGFTLAQTGSPAGATGATCTFAVAPRPTLGDAAVQIRITSRRVHERETDVSRAGRLHTPSFETEQDKVTTTLQELRRDTDGALAEAEAVRGELLDAVLGTVPDGIWTNTKLANMPEASVKARLPGSSDGVPIDATMQQVRSALGVYDTRAALAASHIAGVLNFASTAGYAAAGDNGGAVYKRVGAEPSHPGKVQSADGTWWELAFNVVTPETFGILPSNTDNRTGFSDLASYVNAVGSAVVRCAPGVTYQWWDGIPASTVSTAMAFQDITGLHWQANGSRIAVGGDLIANSKQLRVFQFLDCSNFFLDGIRLEQLVGSADQSYGLIGVYVLNECTNWKVSGWQQGGQLGVATARTTGFAYANQARDFSVTYETDDVYYPFSTQRNGGQFEARITTRGATGRSFFVNNASNWKAWVKSDNMDGLQDCDITAACENTSIDYNACDNWELHYDWLGANPGGTPLAAHIILSFQQYGAGGDTGRISNGKIVANVSYSGHSTFANGVEIVCQGVGGGAETNPVGHYLENIEIGGRWFVMNTAAYYLFDLFTTGLAGFNGATIRNVGIKNLSFVNDGTATPARISIPTLAAAIFLENVRATSVPLTISSFNQAVDAFRSVRFSNFRSSLLSGTSGYQRHPNGIIHQWGRATALASANTNVTLAVTMADTNYAVTGATQGAGNTGVVNMYPNSSSQVALNNPTAGDKDVCWSVMGQAAG